MTSTTRSQIVCQCGHRGFVVLRKNDQPYSALWEHFSLEGFSGETITVTSYGQMPDDILAALRPTCAQCGQTGKVHYARKN
ncbi:MAG TPA: hypothetical protein VGF89_01090 [Steroidobacteraceae bacterium]|jgi:hypothetical protein